MDDLLKNQNKRHLKLLKQLEEAEKQRNLARLDLDRTREEDKKLEQRLLNLFQPKGLDELLFKTGIDRICGNNE